MKSRERVQLAAVALVALSIGSLSYATPAIRLAPSTTCNDAPAIGTMDVAWREPLR